MKALNLSALKTNCQKRWREKRMQEFKSVMQPRKGCDILDIGGLPELWEYAAIDANITLFNLPNAFKDKTLNKYQYIEGDICGFSSHTAGYDLIFSNSVLEHIGEKTRQQQFAQIVSSAPTYWVQVPAPSFPIEAHCGVPFWWYLPQPVKNYFIKGWKSKKKFFLMNQMSTTKPISLAMLKELFPDANVKTERALGFVKSYYVYKNK